MTAALLALAAFLVPGTAAAESSADAQARADALLRKVQAVQAQVDRAMQGYDTALNGLATSVIRSVNAGEASDAAAQQAATDQERLDDRVRGLYMSGGPMALYAGVLDATSVDDLFTRMVLAERVVEVDRSTLTAQQRVADRAAARAASASRGVVVQVRTERSVAQVADRLNRLLAEEQDLLNRAKSEVSRLKAVEAAQARLQAAQAAANGITADRLAALRVLPPPADYLALYRAAAPTCPGLSWTVLAAIGQVESGHGRDTSTSYAGAMGPMQFLPSTFAVYGVDGNGDGRIDIMDPADAIYSAAHYLCANGAGLGGANLYQAIWNYNHADWYVQMVLTLAQRYAEAYPDTGSVGGG